MIQNPTFQLNDQQIACNSALRFHNYDSCFKVIVNN
jgi:hypothetical protein